MMTGKHYRTICHIYKNEIVYENMTYSNFARTSPQCSEIDLFFNVGKGLSLQKFLCSWSFLSFYQVPIEVFAYIEEWEVFGSLCAWHALCLLLPSLVWSGFCCITNCCLQIKLCLWLFVVNTMMWKLFWHVLPECNFGKVGWVCFS